MSDIGDDLGFDPNIFKPDRTANNTMGISQKCRAHQLRMQKNRPARHKKSVRTMVLGMALSPVTLRKFSWEEPK